MAVANLEGEEGGGTLQNGVWAIVGGCERWAGGVPANIDVSGLLETGWEGSGKEGFGGKIMVGSWLESRLSSKAV